jgi:hypothetical protein
MRVVPLDEAQGHVALGLALRHLSNTGLEGCDVVTFVTVEASEVNGVLTDQRPKRIRMCLSYRPDSCCSVSVFF